MGLVQVIIDDSTDKTITGVYTFDRASGGTLAIPHGTDFPTEPVPHELFWLDSERKLYKRNAANTAWEAVESEVVTHASSHESGGLDEIDLTGLSGETATPQPPKAHAASHASGGSDEITIEQTQVTNLVADLDGKLPVSHVENDKHPYLTRVLSSGLLRGGQLSINPIDRTAFDLASGAGVIVDNYTDPANPVRFLIEWVGFTEVPVEHMTKDETYIYINVDGEIVQLAEPAEAERLRDLIYVGWVSHLDHAQIDAVYTEPLSVLSPRHILDDFLESFGAFNIEGNEYYPANANLNLRRTAGRTFDYCANYQNNPKSANILTTEAVNPVEMLYYYRDETGNWVNDASPTFNVDPNHYDTGAGLAAVPTGKWTIQPIMFYAPWETTDIQYGQVVYDSYAEARAAIMVPVVLNPYNALWDTFRGWLIVKQGATDLSDPTQAALVPAGKLGLVSVSSGGGSGGEVNTASNVGTSGVGVFDDKVGVDLQFRTLRAASTKLSVTLDAQHKKIDFDVVPSQIAHQDLSDVGTNTHSQLDAHVASTANPHAVTKSQVGLSDVTNDAQLKRTAGDFATFTEKTTLVDADLAVIEDSAASNAKKCVQLGNLPRRWRWGAKVLTVDADAFAKADYTTIQAAIDAATSGTVILIAPGTYDEVLTLKDGVALIGTGSRRWGGGHVTVMRSSTTPFDLVTKDSSGTAYLENIVFIAVLNGTTSGTVTALNLVSGGVRAKDCLFYAATDATAGTQVVRGVRSTAYTQASECAFMAADLVARNTSVAAVHTSATLEADRCKFSMPTSSSTEGALYITGGTATLWDGHLTAGGGQPIRRTGGTVNLYGVQHVSGAETDDADDPATASLFPRSAYGVLLTNGTGARAYKLPCRAVSGDITNPQDGDIWYNATSGYFRCHENGVTGDLRSGGGGGGTDPNAIHKNVSAEISTITEKTAPDSADLLLIEDSIASNAKKCLQVGNLLPQFGRDYQSAASEGTSTTTSSTFQNKVSLTTGALTGVYLVKWQAELTVNSTTARFQVRLYNSTDAVDLCFHDAPATTIGAYKLVSGFALVTFSGAAKTLIVQFASQNGSSTVTIRRARIALFKVSS